MNGPLKVGTYFKSRVVEWLTDGLTRVVPVRRGGLSNALVMLEEIAKSGAICILVPHADDEIIGCFHLLQKLGFLAPIDLIYVTEDRLPEVAKVRRAESAAATASLAVRERISWSYPDGSLAVHREDLRRRLLDVGERYSLILCLAPSDRTQDHAVLAAEAYDLISSDKLLWYRSTWLTFPLHVADFIAEGDARAKRQALRFFRSQKKLALQNVVSLSTLEARRCGLEADSVEAFRFASSGELSVSPINVLSLKALLQLRHW